MFSSDSADVHGQCCPSVLPVLPPQLLPHHPPHRRLGPTHTSGWLGHLWDHLMYPSLLPPGPISAPTLPSGHCRTPVLLSLRLHFPPPWDAGQFFIIYQIVIIVVFQIIMHKLVDIVLLPLLESTAFLLSIGCRSTSLSLIIINIINILLIIMIKC